MSAQGPAGGRGLLSSGPPVPPTAPLPASPFAPAPPRPPEPLMAFGSGLVPFPFESGGRRRSSPHAAAASTRPAQIQTPAFRDTSATSAAVRVAAVAALIDAVAADLGCARIHPRIAVVAVQAGRMTVAVGVGRAGGRLAAVQPLLDHGPACD